MAGPPGCHSGNRPWVTRRGRNGCWRASAAWNWSWRRIRAGNGPRKSPLPCARARAFLPRVVSIAAPSLQPAVSETRWQIWRGAVRVRTLPAAVAPVMVGSALAWHDGRFVAGAALLCLGFALLVQVGTNFANDYYDFVKGADRSEEHTS